LIDKESSDSDYDSKSSDTKNNSEASDSENESDRDQKPAAKQLRNEGNKKNRDPNLLESNAQQVPQVKAN